MTSSKKNRIKERDGYKCKKCGSRELLTIDHITPLAYGGTDEEDNLITLCKGCNAMKASKRKVPLFKKLQNFLFSRKHYEEIKNDLRGEMSSRDGLVLVEAKQLIEKQNQEISDLLKALKERQTNQYNQIGKIVERIHALQAYQKITWVEETTTFKGYKKTIKSKKAA